MEDENIAFRLKGFIDSQGLSHSQFSDKCGIPRPSLSQILSGRNKKVSDQIVGHIHRAFPELSVLWLLFGEGDMLEKNNAPEGSSRETINFGDNGSLFGDGEFANGSDGFGESSRPANQPSIHARPSFENSGNPANDSNRPFFSNVGALNDCSERLKATEKQLVESKKKVSELLTQIEILRANPRKVSHITVYYEDSTFETFVPKS